VGTQSGQELGREVDKFRIIRAGEGWSVYTKVVISVCS
jgi:hypothetical protein